MDIKKLLGLGNVDAKKAENAENKGKNLPLANDYSEMSEKSYSEHSKASRAAAIALMAATLGAGAPMMTSCVQQEQFVQDDNDNSDIIAVLMQMIAMQQQQIDKMNAILAQMKDDNSSIKSLVESIGKQNAQILSVLQGIKQDTGDIANAIYQLVAMAKISNQNDEEFKAKLDAIIAGQGSNEEKLQAIVDAINTQNETLLNIADLINIVNNNIITVGENVNAVGEKLSASIEKLYQQYKAGNMTMTQLLTAIFNEIKNSNLVEQGNDEEFKQLLLQIIDGQSDNGDKLDNITTAINAQNTILTDIEALIAGVQDQLGTMGKEISAKLSALYEEYKAGNITQSVLLSKIYSEMKTSNCLNASQLQKLEQIYQAIQSADANTAEGMAQIAEAMNQMLDMLNIISDQLNIIMGQLMAVNENLNDQTKELKDIKNQIKGFYNDWKSGNITTNALLAQIMSRLGEMTTTDPAIIKALQDIKNEIKSGNVSDKDAHEKILVLLGQIKNNGNTTNALSAQILAKLADIESAIQSGAMTDEQALSSIIDLLSQIKNNTDVIISKLGTISDQISGLDAKLDANHDSNIDLLKDILLHTANMDGKMDVVIKNQKEANKNMLDISAKSDEIIALLKNLGNGSDTITKEDLKELLGDFYNQILPFLKNAGNNIDIDKIIEAIEANRVDLTKTNALIETLTNVVQTLDFNGKDYASQLQTIINLLGSIQSQGGSDSSKFQDLLQEVLNKLTSIDKNGAAGLDVMNAILDVAKQIKSNQDQFMGDANKFGIKLFEELSKIIDGVGNINTLVAYAESYQEALAKAEQSRQQQIVLLQALVDKEISVSGGSGVTINQLRDLMKELQIPDYTDILNEIKDKIGSVVTSADLQNFFLKTQPDLTKTNALIETLTNVVQNTNVGSSGGSADMSRVETLLGQILDVFNGLNNPTQSQIQDLINALNQIIQNTTPSTPSNAPKKSSKQMLSEAYVDALLKADSKTYIPAELYLGSHISGDDIYHA